MFRRCLAPLLLLVVTINADIYLHFPPGSNNRVNENTANRANDKNAFDSQNNDKGGYNVPDATNQSYGNDPSRQYYLVRLTSRWWFILCHCNLLPLEILSKWCDWQDSPAIRLDEPTRLRGQWRNESEQTNVWFSSAIHVPRCQYGWRRSR